MNQTKGYRAERKLWLQALAFLLIFLPPVGLYLAVMLGVSWATLALLGLVTAGTILAICVS